MGQEIAQLEPWLVSNKLLHSKFKFGPPPAVQPAKLCGEVQKRIQHAELKATLTKRMAQLGYTCSAIANFDALPKPPFWQAYNKVHVGNVAVRWVAVTKRAGTRNEWRRKGGGGAVGAVTPA